MGRKRLTPEQQIISDARRKEQQRINNKKFREANPNYQKERYQEMKDDPEFMAKLACWNRASYRKKMAELTPEEKIAHRKKNTENCRQWRDNYREKITKYNREYMKIYQQNMPEEVRAKRNEAARARYYEKRGLPVPPKRIPKSLRDKDEE